MVRAIITLMTDFGDRDSYVAQMKGAILSINPDVQLVDITHHIAPQSILHGALVLGDSWTSFPAGTIHVAVVDPGVGTRRPIVAAQIGGQRFVLPDNGLLSAVCDRHHPTEVHLVTEPRFWRAAVSHTFHGRDIMAPVAAHLSTGVPLREMGPTVADLARLAIPQPQVEPRCVTGEVLLADSFGNLISNISADLLPALSVVEVQCGDQRVPHVATAYAEHPPGTLVALIGSSQRMEIAVVNGNARQTLGRRVGTPVVARW